MNFCKLRALQGVFVCMLLSMLFLAIAGPARADVGQQELLVDGWYGDAAGNGVLLQEAAAISDGATRPIVVALAFVQNPSDGGLIFFISQPIDHDLLFGAVTTTFRRLPSAEVFAGLLVSNPELQPSPTPFPFILISVRLLIDDVPTGLDDDGNAVLTDINLVLRRLP